MSSKVVKKKPHKSEADKKRARMKRLIIVLTCITCVLIVCAIVVTVLVAKKDKGIEDQLALEESIANYVREDYTVEGDESLLNEMSKAIRENYVYALESDDMYDKMYPYWDDLLIADNNMSYTTDQFKKYYTAIQNVYHTKLSDKQHMDIVLTPATYVACGEYYLFYCTIRYTYVTADGDSRDSGNMQYCFTMRKMGTIDNDGKYLGEQWRFLDFNVQDISAMYTRFGQTSTNSSGQLSPGLYENTQTTAASETKKTESTTEASTEGITKETTKASTKAN